jgi:hypothetical protein
MPYCITLRSKSETRVTGWYAGSDCRWSTDYKRQKLFDEIRDARPVCHELRALCPRNAELINIEAARRDFSLDVMPLVRDRDPLPVASPTRDGSGSLQAGRAASYVIRKG